jgi:hypothetical protein
VRVSKTPGCWTALSVLPRLRNGPPQSLLAWLSSCSAHSPDHTDAHASLIELHPSSPWSRFTWLAAFGLRLFEAKELLCRLPTRRSLCGLHCYAHHYWLPSSPAGSHVFVAMPLATSSFREAGERLYDVWGPMNLAPLTPKLVSYLQLGIQSASLQLHSIHLLSSDMLISPLRPRLPPRRTSHLENTSFTPLHIRHPQ